MAIFSDLPNELVACIWGHILEPEDVESFALVSKKIYRLSTPFVSEHQSLKLQYSKIRSSLLEGNNGPADLLKKMLLDPRIAFYIRKIRFGGWRRHWDERTTPQTHSKAAMTAFEHSVRVCPLITASEVEDWITDITKGNEDPILALIVMQLRKTKSFSLYGSRPGEDRYLLMTLERITRSPDSAIQPGQSIAEAESNGNNQDASPATSMFSTVTSMKTNSSDISLDVLSGLLRRTKELKSFTYIRRLDSNIDIIQLSTELLKCSQHSLRKLTVRDHVQSSHMGDITQFSMLKELSTDFDLLLGSTDETCSDLADALPRSIETVTLNPGGTISFHALKRVLINMITSKTERLPQLQALHFDYGFFHDWDKHDNCELIRSAWAKATEVGVRLTVSGEMCVRRDVLH